jgi:NitT/TauT family transport system permease protein
MTTKVQIPKKTRTLISQSILVPMSLLAGLMLWALFTRVSGLPSFILPSPMDVWISLVDHIADGSLLTHTWITLLEVLGGLALGVFVATILGYALAKSTTVERLLSPYIVASQAIPIVAIAPLLIIWFGPGMLSKILICALIVFFPVLVNIVVGIRSVPENLHALMRSLNASRQQTLRLLEIPAALPVLLGGLRIGATLSVIGAVIGEYIGSDRGLGFLIRLGDGNFDTALVFVAIFALVMMALSLYGIVIGLEKKLLKWKTSI